MKKTVILIYCILLLINCKQTINNKLENVLDLMGKVELNDEINNFILDFFQDHSKDCNCIYELFIDKKTEDEYFLTIRYFVFAEKYYPKNFPVNYAIVNNKIVFIYSGIEDFITSPNYSPQLKADSKITCDYETVSKVIKQDTSYIVGAIGIPFIDEHFGPPIDFENIMIEKLNK
jgi:hypothetical protein